MNDVVNLSLSSWSDACRWFSLNHMQTQTKSITLDSTFAAMNMQINRTYTHEVPPLCGLLCGNQHCEREFVVPFETFANQSIHRKTITKRNYVRWKWQVLKWSIVDIWFDWNSILLLFWLCLRWWSRTHLDCISIIWCVCVSIRFYAKSAQKRTVNNAIYSLFLSVYIKTRAAATIPAHIYYNQNGLLQTQSNAQWCGL